MNKNLCFLFIQITILIGVNGQTLSKETVVMETTMGTMKIKLYEETPLHKANFLKLINENSYDSVLFHRVINEFMIQAGDPLSKRAKSGDSLGHGDLKYTVPAEFSPNLIHTKGKLAAARESDVINPKFESSAIQFYIVMGKVRTLEDLKKYEDRINTTYKTNCAQQFIKSPEGLEFKRKYNGFKMAQKNDSAELVNQLIQQKIKELQEQKPPYKFNETQTKAYTTVGGTPHLDGTYTVFGEVIEGLSCIDKIAAVKTDSRNRPINDIRIKRVFIE
jgi:cyclophilin family peptidyl-prolyl cis-trans isomerase